MTTNLLKISKSFLKGSLLQKSSSFLEEDADDIKESISLIISLLFTGFIHKVNKGKSEELFESVNNYNANKVSSDEIEDLFKGENSLLFDKNYNFLSSNFKNNLKESNELIADYTGVHEDSASSLIKVSLPLVLKAISNKISSENLDAVGFSKLITEQKQYVNRTVSADFMNKLIHDVGFYTLVTDNSTAFAQTIENKTNKSSYAKMLGGIGLVSIVGFFIYQNLFKTNENSSVENINTSIHSKTVDLEKIADIIVSNTDYLYNPTKETLGKYIKGHEDLGYFEKKSLKSNDNNEILVLSNGGLHNFIKYLEENKPVSKNVWFDLNRTLVVDKEKIDLDKSNSEISNLITILHTYPNIHIKIGAMTDNVGPADENFDKSFKLSEKFTQLLISKGIDADRLTYEGYGENYPVKSNESNQKHLNNRIAIRLSKK